jgi:hypothetical protein
MQGSLAKRSGLCLCEFMGQHPLAVNEASNGEEFH